ncbi:hypothetical protein ES703_107309 [subsurface metagenome]
MSKIEEEISTYLNNLDRTDKLLIRDIYYLFCGGIVSRGERLISKILTKGGKKVKKKKRTIEPCGTITQTKDFFKFKSKNIGVFKKPKEAKK